MGLHQLNAPVRSFREWVKSTRDVAVIACIASLVGAVVIASAMQMTHQIAKASPDTPLVLSVGPWSITTPDYTVSLVVAVTLLLTLATVTGAYLGRLDAVLARRHLRRTWRARGHGWGGYGPLIVERNLLENWANQLSSLVQVVVLSIALAYIGGWLEAAGMAASLVLMSLLSLLFWRRARRTSLQFIEARRAVIGHPDGSRRQRRANPPPVGDGLAVVDAMYARDTQAMRMPPWMAAVLSVGLVFFAMLPLLEGGQGTELVLVLIVLLIWRQRATECVMGVGRLTWQVTVWQHQQRSSADDGDDGDEIV